MDAFTYAVPAFVGVLLGAVTVRGSLRALREKGPLGRVLTAGIVYGSLSVGYHATDQLRPFWLNGLILISSILLIVVLARVLFGRAS